MNKISDVTRKTSDRENYDFVIRNAMVIDGTGQAGYQADVGIIDDKIATIGDLTSAGANHSVDAEGLCLAPGFIDVHTHDDMQVLKNPDMLCKVSQGVTTVVVGNCGISASPVRLTSPPPDPMNLLGEQDDFKYQTFADYVEKVNRTTPSVNVAALVGHTALRNNVMDKLDRAATDSEIEQMKDQLEQALQEGAIGLSTGLAYSSAPI